MTRTAALETSTITRDQFLEYWQGHRRVTRRVIESFPETELFNYSIGGMRPFAALVQELLMMDTPMVTEIAGVGEASYAVPEVESKDDLLRVWDEHTEELSRLWPQLPAGIFQETRTVAGAYTSQVWDLLSYAIDNEVHHRGQGYVYLRSLGVEPPAFYDRG